MQQIQAFGADYDEYRRDESRAQGEAESISFPTTEDEVSAILSKLAASGTAVTVQGARTGLAAGAVPYGGHVMNLSHMNRCLGARRGGDGAFYLTVQPGVILSELRKYLANKTVPCTGWADEDLEVLEQLYAAPTQFFPTDPTEASACLGGMAACNASGARSYRYGPMRPHVSALRVALADGDVVALKRGEVHARGRALTLETVGGRCILVPLPAYTMPASKNASGYYAEDNMDAVDLFIGSDGTLGVITQLELRLSALPALTWGVNCFFMDERSALDATIAMRDRLPRAAALEYFDGDALDVLRSQRERSAAFSSLPAVPKSYAACVYVELECDDAGQAAADLRLLGDLLDQCGSSPAYTWVARTDVDRERQRFFRHAVPESVNMLIDERRRTDPSITKLGSDMSVPNERLHEVVALYRGTLAQAGLQSAAWGHIGNNHLHVNILPRNAQEYAAGKRLFARWAREVTAMGGAVSAEHGVGKIKRDFLRIMYGDQAIAQMADTKAALDPQGILGRGNLFDEDELDAAVARAKGGEL